MISRQWRGVAKAACAEAYVEHLQTETFPALANISGFIEASILRRAVPGGVEFLVITQWASPGSIQAFAGKNIEQAVVPPQVQEMMITYDRVVHHYDVVH